MRDNDAIIPFQPPAPELEVLERFLAGEGTADEVARIRAWAGEFGGSGTSHAEEVRAAIMAYADSGTSDIERTQQRLRERLGLASGASLQKSRAWKGGEKGPQGRYARLGGGFGKQALRGWLGAVGVVMTFAVLAVITRQSRPDNPANTEITRTYTTTANQGATLNLDDGTHITLAPSTTIRLVHFGGSSRNVALDHGEAYFEVSRATASPFIVRSGGIIAHVLGTGFLVRQDVSGHHVTVSVDVGKVRVMQAARASSAVTLSSGQIGNVEDSTIHVSTVDDLMPGVERAPGQLMFHDTPVAAILQTVSQWYGYRFHYTDQTMAQRPVTMIISTQSSAEALAAIERVLSVNLTITGDTITLTPHPVRALRGTPKAQHYDVWTPTKEVGR